MRAFRNFFILGLSLFFSASLFAQQLTHPMLVEFTHPASVAGNYIYGYQTDWGPTNLAAPVTGQVEWAYDITPDSIGCDTMTMDLTGKIPMIRRGACNFSLKALNAQTQGAIGCIICNSQVGAGTINMAGGTFGAQVTIPAVMLSYEDCALLDAALQNGDSLSVTFRKPFISAAIGKWAHETPQAHIQDLTGMSVDITNAGSSVASNVTVNLNIEDPAGNVTTLTETIPSLGIDSTNTVTFANSFTPTLKGNYTMNFSSSLATDSLFEDFIVGDTTWALDENQDFTWIGVTDQGYIDASYRFDMGNYYLSGANGGAAAWASFALDNGAAYIGKQFNILLYDLTGATGQETDYSTFNPVGVASHVITAADTVPNTFMTARLFDLNSGADSVALTANTEYLLVVSYTGDSTILPAPRFTYSGTDEYLGLGSTVYLDRLYLGGFNGGYKAAIRLHMDGSNVVSSTQAEKIEASSFDVFPNPASSMINVQLNLDAVSSNVDLRLIDMQGRVLDQSQYADVQHATYTFNTEKLTAGTYFIRVATDKGYNIKQFVKK